MRITGTIDAPQIDGTGRLTNGSAYLPQTGVDLEAIELTLVGRNDLPVRLSGSASSGGGELALDGTLNYSESTGPYAELNVTGENFQVIRFPNQTVYVSPDLQTRIDMDEIAVSGSIKIPRADIIVEALPESATVPSRDVIVETNAEEAPAKRLPIEFTGNLELVLGDDIHFAGFGLNTQLAGSLSLSQTRGSASPLTEGSLRTVEGRFEAYRKKLTIERGRVDLLRATR